MRVQSRFWMLAWGACLAASAAWGGLAPFTELREKGVHAFSYGGEPFLFGRPVRTELVGDTARAATWRLVYTTRDGKLELHDTWIFYKRFPAAEVRPELVCRADGGTEIIDDFQSLDWRVATAGATVRALRGTVCTANDFTPADCTLAAAGAHEAVFDVAEARSSSAFMPWFGIDLADGTGCEIGIGWTGGWTARFTLEGGTLRLRAGLRRTHFRLLKGESLRQPSLLFFRREGMGVSAVRTALHRFMREEKLPRDRQGRLIEPLLPLTAGGGNKPDKMMLDIIDWSAKNAMPFNTFWVDAAWYGPPQVIDPYPNCGSTWWRYVGNWTFNTAIHPDGNLLKVSEAARAHGMKFLLWMEPERAMDDQPFAKDHPAWMLPADWQKTANPEKPQPLLVNLGDAACRTGLVELVSGLVRSNKLDVFRQDFNLGPAPYWNGNDAPDRVGVTEAKHITGLYAFWDELRRRFPDLLIENCASGARRLDFEMVSRSHSYCRTDFAIGHKNSLDQIFNVQNITLNTLAYQPFQGSETTPAAMFDDYGFFSAVCAGSVFTPSDWDGGIVRRAFSDREMCWLKKVFAAAARMREGFMGDFYPQTPPASLARDVWVAYQLHRPDRNAGFAIAFRRPACREATFAFALEGLQPTARYRVTRYDGDTTTLTGAELAALKVTLADPLAFALFFYEMQ